MSSAYPVLPAPLSSSSISLSSPSLVPAAHTIASSLEECEVVVEQGPVAVRMVDLLRFCITQLVIIFKSSVNVCQNAICSTCKCAFAVMLRIAFCMDMLRTPIMNCGFCRMLYSDILICLHVHAISTAYLQTISALGTKVDDDRRSLCMMCFAIAFGIHLLVNFVKMLYQLLGFLSRILSFFVYKCVLSPAAALFACWPQSFGRSRSHSTSPRKHVKRDFSTRTCKEILFWLVAFLLLLAFFRVRPPENGKGSEINSLGGYFRIATSAERTQQVERLDFCATISLLCAVGFLSECICSSVVNASKSIPASANA